MFLTYSTCMSKAANLKLSTTVFKKLEEMPNNISESIRRAVHQANRDPEILVLAFKLRLAMPPYTETRSACYRADERFREAAEELKERTKLSLEEAIRLSVEAYVYRLE